MPLSTGEYNLLLALVTHARRVLTRDQLLDLAQGRELAAFERSVDNMVSRLRRKIEPDPRQPGPAQDGPRRRLHARRRRPPAVRRLLPSSLLGQMLLLIGAALLVAQAVNFAFILNEQQKLSLARNEGPAIGRFTQAAAVVAATPPEGRPLLLAAHRVGPGADLPAGAAKRRSTARGSSATPEIEERLAAVARARRGVPVRAVRGASRGDRTASRPRRPPPATAMAPRQSPGRPARRPARRRQLARRPASTRPAPIRWLIHRLLLATAILFLLVFGAAWWIARRLARPLRDLTRAAEGFEGRGPAEPVTPRGPSDVRRAVEAFNAMNRRTLALLDEKDRMLGAIGHDLRTPLASLRIRAENMGPEEERERLVATVEEMAATLEDILTLARTGRAREPVRPVDLAALADALVEEYRELGRPAAFQPSPRAVLAVQPNLLRRALRNLIDNAHRLWRRRGGDGRGAAGRDRAEGRG